MSKILHIVILLVLVSSSSAAFLRPWDNQTWVGTNPHIYSSGVTYWWNLPALHTTLESIDTGRALSLELPEGTRSTVRKAADASSKAAQQKELCIMSLIASLGAAYWAPSALMFTAFSEGFGCISYKDSWKSAVSESLSAAEDGLSASALSVERAREAYHELVFLGLCESDYRGPGSEDCSGLRSAFISVDNGITEGRYGSYALLLEQERSLKKSLTSPAPDLSGWAAIPELAFGRGGAIETFEMVRKDAGSAKERAEAAYLSGLDSASIRKAETEKRIADMESQKLFLIRDSLSGYGIFDVGSIQERFAVLLEQKGSADGLLARAKAAKARTRESGHLAAAVDLISRADRAYLELSDSLGSLDKDAEAMAIQKKEEAEKEISRTQKAFSSKPPGTEAMETLAEAREALDKGDKASLTGVRFAFYSQAAALARAARDGVAMDSEAAAGSALAILGDLIKRAEKDSLSVPGEKEVLRLISSLPSVQAEAAAQDAIDSIVLKAKARHESEILSSRARIYDKLALAGPDAADLYTDMKNLEAGILSESGPVYPQAIGSLSMLIKGYLLTESQLDLHMEAIVGNTMSADAMPSFGPVELDQPAEIIVDAVLSNPRPYGADTATATIRTGRFGFLYSDIAYGREGVTSVRETGEGLAVVLSGVRPFETRRIVFQKTSVIARTLKNTVSANGLGGGKAFVSRTMEFELDHDIPSLALPEDCPEALIDGLPPKRQLKAGRHTLSCERMALDAYDESVANFNSYPITATSRVEFDIRITTRMDLDTVPVLVDSPDSSTISRFKVIAVAGGHIKEQSQLSEGQYSVTMASLVKGDTAVLRVSYTIDDTPSFVQSQLSALQSANLSAEARSLVEQAAIQASAANYSQALSLISQALARSKADEKDDAKLTAKKEDLLAKARDEMSQLDAALSSALSGSGFTDRLSARKDELSRVIEEAESQGLGESVQALGKLDLKWMDKELAAFKKDAYKSYNDLKERFFLAGNTTTPDDFLLFEAAFQKLGAGGRVEYAVEASEALASVARTVSTQEHSKSSEHSRISFLLESLESEALAVMDHYSREASAAKGTDYSGMFTISQSRIDRIVKDAEAALKKDPSLAPAKMDELRQTKDAMEMTLESLRAESDAKISVLGAAIESSDADEGAKAGFRIELDSIRGLAASGDYVNSLRAGSSLAKKLDGGSGPSNNGLVVLGLTALAMLAAAGFYMFKQQKPKELRKLPSFNDRMPGKAAASEKTFTSSPLSPLSARPSLSQKPPAPASGSSQSRPGKPLPRTPPDREPG